jgi:hypothetical protein
MSLPESILTKKQVIQSDWKLFNEGTERIRVKIRYDDECNNKHNTFAITGETEYLDRGRWREGSGGCIHDQIQEHFPEYAHLIKWHLCSSDQPMYYVNNTVYLAGDKDCWGRSKGEPSSFEYAVKFNNFNVPFTNYSKSFIKWIEENRGYLSNIKLVEVPYGKDNPSNFSSKLSPEGYTTKWHECPFALDFYGDTSKNPLIWDEFVKNDFEIIKVATSFSEGKERELDKARNTGIWPDATDEQLSLPKEELTKLLLDRLPALMAEFRKDIESLGFVY